MKINIKDINGNSINLGDEVEILKITDESGSATDLFGVEPHLNSWIDIVYVEAFRGVVAYDEEKLMVVIKGKSRSIPLSNYVRYNIWLQAFDMVKKEDLKQIVKDYDLPDGEYETIVDYIVVLQNS